MAKKLSTPHFFPYIGCALIIHLGGIAIIAVKQRGSSSGTTNTPLRVSVKTIQQSPAPQEEQKSEKTITPTKKTATKKKIKKAPRKKQRSAQQKIDQPNTGKSSATGRKGNGKGSGDSYRRSAKMIRSSFVEPEYTKAALRANYRDVISAAVLVGKKGEAKKVRLDKEAPFGMSKRIIESLMAAKYSPSIDGSGYPIENWVKMRFYLEIK